VDASPEMVAAARSRGIEASEGSAELLPFADGVFDAVFSNAALHWVRDQDAMMQQVRRVLKPGGRFVAEMGGHGNVAAIRVALTAVLARYGYGDREVGENYYPTPDRVDSAAYPVGRRWHDWLAADFSARRAGGIAGGAARAGSGGNRGAAGPGASR